MELAAPPASISLLFRHLKELQSFPTDFTGNSHCLTFARVLLHILLLLALLMIDRFVNIEFLSFVFDRCPSAAGLFIRVNDFLAVNGPGAGRTEDGFGFLRLNFPILE